MKKLTIVFILTVFFATGTVFGAVAKKVIEVLQKDNIATVFVSAGEIKLYKIDDGKNTCYISNQDTINGARLNQHAISCVKN